MKKSSSSAIQTVLDSNRDKLLERAIKVEELPPDDEWIRIIPGMKYKQEEVRNGESIILVMYGGFIFHMKTRTRKKEPAIVIDDDTIAILTMYVTNQNKENPYSIKLEDWAETGLSKPSWTRIDKIVSINGGIWIEK